jgi:hypothetical protein
MADPLRSIRTDRVLADTRPDSSHELPGRYHELLACGHPGEPIGYQSRPARARRCPVCGSGGASPFPSYLCEVELGPTEVLAEQADWAAWHERRYDPASFARYCGSTHATLNDRAERYERRLRERSRS